MYLWLYLDNTVRFESIVKLQTKFKNFRRIIVHAERSIRQPNHYSMKLFLHLHWSMTVFIHKYGYRRSNGSLSDIDDVPLIEKLDECKIDGLIDPDTNYENYVRFSNGRYPAWDDMRPNSKSAEAINGTSVVAIQLKELDVRRSTSHSYFIPF
jgi:hypothetical protein